jgi:beta-galactosidase/beta-glucuronidase
MESAKTRTYAFAKTNPIFSWLFACVFFLSACQSINSVKMKTEGQMTTIPTDSAITFPAASSQLLDGNWRFSVDRQKKGESEMWFASGYDDSAWQVVSVPHTWNVMPDYSQFNGLGWYLHNLAVPASSQGMHLRLRFQSVFYLAKVWVNGDYVGEHEGGYTPFEFDVTKQIRPGENNVIAIQTDNKLSAVRIPAQLNGGWSYDWWNYGGIVRPVSLESTNPVYISKQQIVAIPHLTGEDEADQAEVSSTVEFVNTSEDKFDGLVNFSIMHEETRQVVIDSGPGEAITLAPGQTFNLKLSTTLANPKLWHFDHPNLYILAVFVKKDGQEIHHLESTFGIRSVELEDGQMILNGEPVRLVGVTRHADSPQFGLAESVQIMAADYDDIKRLNEVLSRPVHYPQAEFILDYADRHGILLIPEVPAWQLTAQQMSMPKMRALEKQQLGEMISSEYNHPAIWAWSIGNEIESETTEGYAFVKEMLAYVKSLDPTRPVGFASNRLNSNPSQDATAYSDFVMMNQYWGGWAGPKQGLSGALDAIHAAWPDKTVIISEFGFEPNWNRLWGPATSTLNLKEYYFIPDGTPPDSEIADEQRRLLIQDQMAVFRTKPFVAGAVFWTYQDYRTRSLFKMGVVDPDRNKRLSWYTLREEFSPVIIDLLFNSPVTDGQRKSTIVLHTRGPIEADMPAYTLRGYTLHWEVTSLDGNQRFSEGIISLPTLAPASNWSGEIIFTVPPSDYMVKVSIIRPTGFSVIDRSYSSEGILIQ